MNSEKQRLLVGLKRAISALNSKVNFVTPEGIKSYDLLRELDALVKEAEKVDND